MVELILGGDVLVTKGLVNVTGTFLFQLQNVFCTPDNLTFCIPALFIFLFVTSIIALDANI